MIPAEDFKRKDAGSYDQQAYDYDKYIRRLAAPLADHVCRLAELVDGSRVLDVGTGSGLAARRAAQAVAPSGSVVGVDLSAGMIECAGASGPPAGSAALEFRIMDAEHLNFPDNTFDAITSLCAVLHFPDIAVALREMYRVLKPGKRLVVSFGRTQPVGLRPMAGHYIKRSIERLSRLVEPRLSAPYDFVQLASRFVGIDRAPMLTTWSSKHPVSKLCSALRAAGFEDTTISWVGHTIVFESAAEFVEAQLAISTLLRKTMQGVPAERAVQLRDLLLTRAEQVRAKGGKLEYPYGAIFFASRRPAD